MSTVSLVTAEELLALPTGMGKRYELVSGELRVMSPSGWRHGQVVSNLHNILGPFIHVKQLGRTFGAETGFLLERSPDTVRAPEFAFIARENLPKDDPEEAFWPGVPDLLVEVLSPGDRTGEVDEKIAAWLSAGSRSVWIVDPVLETVTIYHSRTHVRVLTAVERIENDATIPGFSCGVDELFK
jgi:Uma2 family endonuclease